MFENKKNNTRIFYVHVPKAGGTSIWTILTQHFGEAHSLNCGIDHLVDPRSMWHMDPIQWEIDVSNYVASIPNEIRYIQGHFPVTRFLGKCEGFFFTWIRHPYLRALSNYFFWKKFPSIGHYLHDYVINNHLSFQRYIELPLVQNIMTRHFFPNDSFWKLDFFGFQETFDEDFRDLCKRLEIKSNIKNRTNVTQYPSTEYWELLNSESIFKRFCILNKEDMDLFWYAKELRNQQIAAGERLVC